MSGKLERSSFMRCDFSEASMLPPPMWEIEMVFFSPAGISESAVSDGPAGAAQAAR